jgi:hypothetical protein
LIQPTAFADLNDVLAELVAGTRAALGAALCGVYLQGSFAVGDADEHSDVDFVTLTEDALTAEQVDALRSLHRRLHVLDSEWARHLEGSYATTRLFRRLDPARTPLLYLDNGASELVWDAHCNTAVVRWSLRERGVVLTGPDPKTVVEPVSAEDLRAEVRAALPEWAAWAGEPTKAGPMSRWKQALLVLSCCRMLHTLASGVVASKREAGEWALGELPARWHDLIRHSLAERPDPWQKVYQPADPRTAAETLAFVGFAVGAGEG